MDDLTINRRLAEIAGVPLGRPSDEFGREGNAMKMPHKQGLWSPLTDWSQLGPLMERFKVTIDHYHSSAFGPERFRAACDCVGSLGFVDAEDSDYVKAICLAIIAAHEEE